MKVTTLFLVSLLVVAASADFIAKNDDFAVLSEIDKEPFGSSILSAVSVHMHTESPMAEITKLLHSVAKQLRHDQRSATKAWVVYHFACKTDIKNYDNAIFFHNRSLFASRKLKWRNEQLLSKARVAFASEKRDLKTFRGRLASGTVLRAKQHAAWLVFKKEHKTAIAAIAQALALVNKLHTTSFLQLQSSFTRIISELSTHKHLHSLYTPLLSILTDLNTNVSPQNIKRIRHLLKKIRGGLRKALRFERKVEKDRRAAWRVLSADLRQNIKTSKAHIMQLRAAIHLYKRTIVTATKSILTHSTQLEFNRKALARRVAQCNRYQKWYKAQKAERIRELKILKRLMHHFQSKITTVREYLKARVNK